MGSPSTCSRALLIFLISDLFSLSITPLCKKVSDVLIAPTAVYSRSEIKPEPKSQILNNPYERLWKDAKFDCKEFGVDSCFFRFITMSACTFAQRSIAVRTSKNL